VLHISWSGQLISVKSSSILEKGAGQCGKQHKARTSPDRIKKLSAGEWKAVKGAVVCLAATSDDDPRTCILYIFMAQMPLLQDNEGKGTVSIDGQASIGSVKSEIAALARRRWGS